MQKVCLLTNYNLYESKRYFTQKLSEAFQRHQIETIIIDAQEYALGAEEFKELYRFAPDFTCSFNTLLPASEGKYYWDYLKIPHLSILVDPAIYYINLTNSPYSIISCVDRFDCEAIRSNQFDNVFFWPHAVEKELCEEELSKERPYDVVFLGTCYDYETLRTTWQQSLSPANCRILDHAIDLSLSDYTISLPDALVRAWNEATEKPEESGVDFMMLFYYLDYYSRGKDRVELIRSIKDAQVHVFGAHSEDVPDSLLGWSEYLALQPNVVVHPPVSFTESFSILKKSKICLNSMPFFKNGSHERILNGLACGALPLTTDNLYIKEVFHDGEEVILYQNTHLDRINDQVNERLANEKKRRESVEKGREKVRLHHTWDKRVEGLLKTLPSIIQRIGSHAK